MLGEDKPDKNAGQPNKMETALTNRHDEILTRIDHLVSESWFDSPAEVKPAKKRQNTSERSLAALAVHRKGTQIGGPNARYCSRCRRLAVRGMKVCYFHGGAKTAVQRKKDKGLRAVDATRRIKRNAYYLMRDGLLPDGLVKHPAFVATWKVATTFTAGGGLEKVRRKRACGMLLHELVRSWTLMERDGNHAVWAEAVRKAKVLGLI